ncbi:MAG: long-chain fatty acid--CoA ligase, partial [Myxococcales bacterium]|nr:long-chain fatty acid--CoA ligase [Myxococcales bacterium]
MDPTPYLELKPAARVLFDSAAQHVDNARFMLQVAGDWQPVTWRQHAQAVREVACGLRALGLQPGERGAVFAPNRVAWMEAALGLGAAQAVMVPVYPSNTAEQLAYVVDHADAAVVFVDTAALVIKLRATWSAIAHTVRHVVVFDSIVASATQDFADEMAQRTLSLAQLRQLGSQWDTANPQLFEHGLDSIALDDIGIMLYTSGTSGNPKGVPLTHRNVGTNGRDWLLCNGPQVEVGDVDLLWLPMSHIFGFGEACLGNTLGFTSYLCEPQEVLVRLPEVKPQVLMSVPLIWEKLAQFAANTADPRAGLREITGGRLRFCLSGGAGLKREVKEFFADAGLLILEGYGLTEASPTLTLNRPDAYRFDSVGKPLPSVDLKLAADGEILARGPSIFGGYHKDPAATEAIFDAEGWLLTGDVGRWTADGFLQIIDRKKDILVTSGGKNVPPANIEQQFADEPLIAQAVVYGDGKSFLVVGLWPNALMIPILLAEFAPSDRPAEVHRRLAAKVAEVNTMLAKHETIKRFAVMPRSLSVEGGQLTPTLKVKRKRVCEEFRSEFEALYLQ